MWITHYILSKNKLFKTLKIDPQDQRIYDEFTGVELFFSELDEYLFGEKAREEILEFINIRKLRDA